MNKLQYIFKSEERARRNHKKEVLALLLFCLTEPRQFKYILRWRKSLKKGHSPLIDEAPWLTYGAIEYLGKIIKPHMKVFEYGSGGSTIWFAKRVAEVVSVEHDKEWLELVVGKLKKEGLKNARLILKSAKKSTEKGKYEYFRSTKEVGMSFKDYVLAIDSFADQYFDLVVVDGRARVACIRQAYSKVKPGGYLVLDNSERKDYHEAFLFMKRRAQYRKDFFGVIAYGTGLMQTTLWRVKTPKPEDDLY